MAVKQKTRTKRRTREAGMDEVRFPPLARPDPTQYRRDMAALQPYLDGAEADHQRVQGLPLWKPTTYERRYLPALRMAGLRGKSRIVSVGAGGGHSVALTDKGRLLTWGRGPAPTSVADSGWAALSAVGQPWGSANWVK